MRLHVVGEALDHLAAAGDLLEGLGRERDRGVETGNGHNFVGGERTDTNNNSHNPMKPQVGRATARGIGS